MKKTYKDYYGNVLRICISEEMSPEEPVLVEIESPGHGRYVTPHKARQIAAALVEAADEIDGKERKMK